MSGDGIATTRKALYAAPQNEVRRRTQHRMSPDKHSDHWSRRRPSACVSERNRRQNARTIAFAIMIRIRSICYNRMRKPRWTPSHLRALQRVISSNGRPRNTMASIFMFAQHCVSMRMRHFRDTGNNGISKSESLKRRRTGGPGMRQRRVRPGKFLFHASGHGRPRVYQRS